MRTIRAFIAIDISDEARAVLADVTETLARQTTPGAVKWVEPDRIHLTLRFLGSTPLDRLDELGAMLDTIAAQQAPFLLTLSSLACFPNERRPRVIWIGVGGQVARAQALHVSIEAAIEPLGWEPEGRDFQPHLTLGRVKEKGAAIKLPWGTGVAPAEIEVSEIVLFESQLRPDGPRYVARYVSKFGGGS